MYFFIFVFFNLFNPLLTLVITCNTDTQVFEVLKRTKCTKAKYSMGKSFYSLLSPFLICISGVLWLFVDMSVTKRIELR